MQPVRDVVWREVLEGRVEVTQGGEVREYECRNEIRGPIRVRRGKKWVEGEGMGDEDGTEEVEEKG